MSQRLYGHLRWVLKAAGVGSALGLLLFAAESLLALRDGSIGINLEVEGPYATLFSTVRSQLFGLLARIAIAYVGAGFVLGALSGLLAWWMAGARVWRWPVMILEFCGLSLLLAWDRAIMRPALFDDLPALRPILETVVDSAQPWHPRAALVFFLLAQIALLFPRILSAIERAIRAQMPTATPARKWGVVAVAVIAAGLFISRSHTGSSHRHPLVVLVGIDAFRPDRLSVYGSKRPVAPNLENFVKDATLFDQAYTPLAQTEPAWRSLLTARWPDHTGVRYPLTAESRWVPLPTFSQALTEAGYHTTFVTDCSRFNYQGANSGFVDRRQPPRGAINFVLEKLRYRALGVFGDNAIGAKWLPEFIDNRALAGIHDPIGFAQRLSKLLVEKAKDGPLLFAYHNTAAHFPGDPVYPYYRAFVDGREPLERRLRMSFAPIAEGSAGQGSREASEGIYDELLAQADAQLGIILDGLKTSGLYQEALVIVFSDHGESFHADQPALAGATPAHGSRLSEEENRILLAIKLPASEGQRLAHVSALVRLIDIGPSVLELAGLPALREVDGVSLVPLLRGQSMTSLELFAETGFTHARPDAFDPDHLALAPRTFDAYRIRPDGVIELTDVAHQAVLMEKDFGRFDGRRWLILSPRKDGTVKERCVGDCRDARSSLDRASD